MTEFRVRTAVLDLPPLVGALARRLHDGGVPVDADRAVRLARALTLTAPVARRRLYWTARAVLVSERAQVPVFDRVFAEVFGGGGPEAGLTITVADVHLAPTPHDERPHAERDADGARRRPRRVNRAPPSSLSATCPSPRSPPTRRCSAPSASTLWGRTSWPRSTR
jgi:uncharacterized protein with von Willebrand factor type A (vWA) domain